MSANITAVLRDVEAERRRQDEKWGSQAHMPGLWLAILGEEFGEVATEVAEGGAHGLDRDAYRAELVQVAAVAVAAIEALDYGAAGL